MTLDLAPQCIVEPNNLASGPRRPRGRLRLAAYAASVAAGALILEALLPVVSGAPWRSIETTLSAIPIEALLGLVALWAVGLVAHTVTLTAALPGLSHRRALLLSLTGSAVANLLPLGGAAGMALNYRMTRTWGFSSTGFASYTVVTNLCNVLTKLFLPALVAPLLLLGLPVGSGLAHTMTAALMALPVVAGVAIAAIVHPRAAARLGSRAEQVRVRVSGIVVASWRRLGIGMVAHTTLLLALLAVSLAATGALVQPGFVLLAFCAERLATLVGLTPGGFGLVEVGLAGALMLAPGADAAGVAAGTLLYRALTFGIQIPVGGALLAAWTWRQRAAA